MMGFVSTAALAGWLYGGAAVDPEARANFPALMTMMGEGSVDYAYPDDEGNITTGRGNLIPDLAAFMSLDWRAPDGSPASSNTVQTAWIVLQNAAMQVKLAGPAKWPGGGHYAGLTAIRATQASLNALVSARIDQFEATLRKWWPGWDDAPPPAQSALMRVCWAVGPGRLDVHWPSYWPKLHAAWVARDWATCSRECIIPALDRDEPNANAAEAALFLSCVRDAPTLPELPES